MNAAPWKCSYCGAVEVDGYVSHMSNCPLRLAPIEPKRVRRPGRFRVWWSDIYWPEVWVVIGGLLVGLVVLWLILEGVNGEW